ncbi:MAG: hypothetical protein EPN61_04965 [Burkholderiaceae bacterium]|nr:MAG: hypothetical protein EPN61_04965 [Burkholderiaceae bacterium]
MDWAPEADDRRALLEDCPSFNAGKGAVYTDAGTHEMDACVTDGRTLAAGAGAGVTRVRNPVLAARSSAPHWVCWPATTRAGGTAS